jgi:hypothetical protein
MPHVISALVNGRVRCRSLVRPVIALVFGLSVSGCSTSPEEPVSSVSSPILVAPVRTAEARRNELPPDYVRAQRANEAMHQFDREHPSVLRQPPTEVPAVDRDRTPEGGISDERFLMEPDLTLGSGLLVADVTFLGTGVRDDYALEPTGRYRVTTMRYRVRANALVRADGLPVPAEEFDLFTTPSFVPPRESGRILAVLGDHSMRPGFNLKVATPLSASGGLTQTAFGAAGNTAASDVIQGLRVRAARIDTAGGGA